jgi:hypothetical protein
MAFWLLGFRGWESGEIPSEDFYTGVDTEVSTTYGGRTGSYHLLVGDAAAYYRVDVTGNPNNLGMSVGTYFDAATWSRDDADRFQVVLTSGEIIELKFDATNKTYDAYVDGVKVADGSVSITDLAWQHVQFYTLIADSGSIKTRINGVDDINYSGDTLPAGATAQVEYAILYNGNGGIGNQFRYWDDFAWGTGDYPGDVRVEALMPTADTAVDDFTPTAGDSFECVNERPPNDTTDYIYSDTNGHATELDLADFDATNKTPIGVNAFAYARQLAGGGQQLKIGVDTNGTHDTDTKNLSTDWELHVYFMDENLDDASEWEDADIDALKARIEAVISI